MDDAGSTDAGRLPLFIFDGHCGFCCKWALWLRGRGLEHVRFEPFDSLDAADRHGVTAHDMETASFFVDGSGRVHRGSDGFIRALAEAALPWRMVARVASVRAVRAGLRPLYGVIARHRHQLPAPESDRAGFAACGSGNGQPAG